MGVWSLSAKFHEQTKRSVATPAKELKIAVQRQQLSRIQFISQMIRQASAKSAGTSRYLRMMLRTDAAHLESWSGI